MHVQTAIEIRLRAPPQTASLHVLRPKSHPCLLPPPPPLPRTPPPHLLCITNFRIAVMSSKITLDKDVKKQLDVRPLLPVIQSIRATRHCALTWSRSLHLH